MRLESEGMTSVAVSERLDRNINERLQLGVRILCAFLVGLLIFLFHAQYSKSNYLLSDSADYVRAARASFLHTYFNTDSASPVQLLAMRHEPAFHAHPWGYLYFHDDNAAIRHFHVPFSFYPMHVVSSLTSADSKQRVVSSVVTATTCGALVIGLSAFEVPLVISTLVAIIAGVQSRYVKVSVDPSPHSWYMLFALLFLFIFSTYLNTRRFRFLAISAILLGFAFATLEFSLELIASIPLALAIQWILDRRALGNLKGLLTSFAKALPVFLLTAFVVWPGGWIRGGYLESYGVTGSTVLFKNKAAFGSHATAASLYRKLFGGHEILLALFAFAAIALIVSACRRKLSTVAIVFTSYTAVAFALGIADHFRLDTYISETLLFFLATAAFLFHDWLTAESGRKRRLSILTASAVLIVVGVQEWMQRPSIELYKPWLKPIIAGVSSKIPTGATILVNDNWEAYYAYLPGYNFDPTVTTSSLISRYPCRSKEIHFALLTNRAPRIPNATLLEVFPTVDAEHTINLYRYGK